MCWTPVSSARVPVGAGGVDHWMAGGAVGAPLPAPPAPPRPCAAAGGVCCAWTPTTNATAASVTAMLAEKRLFMCSLLLSDVTLTDLPECGRVYRLSAASQQ